MGMAVGGSGGMNSDINVTPMVDIMLVLLIIFMVVTPLLQHGVSVTLPQNMRNPEEDSRIIKETSVVVAVTKDDQLYFGKQVIAKDALKSEIEAKMAEVTRPEDRVVYIKGDAEANYGSVVEAVNIIRQAGIDRIGLVADKVKGGGATAAPATAPA
jgi:biopolymer transport protein ExbD/biopolymer transport protein TolR